VAAEAVGGMGGGGSLVARIEKFNLKNCNENGCSMIIY
jgi:hypothetical protein